MKMTDEQSTNHFATEAHKILTQYCNATRKRAALKCGMAEDDPDNWCDHVAPVELTAYTAAQALLAWYQDERDRVTADAGTSVTVDVPPENLKIGQRVITDYTNLGPKSDTCTIRRITRIEKRDDYGSGYSISVDGGLPCPGCKRTAQVIEDVDAPWFRAVSDSVPENTILLDENESHAFDE